MKRIAAFVQRNLGLKIFSLVLAYVTWAYVAGREPAVRFVNAPVEIEAPAGLAVVNYEPSEVRVKLTGDAPTLNRLQEENVWVRVRLEATLRPGRAQRIAVQPREIMGVPSGIMREVPGSGVVNVTVDRKVTRVVPVRVRISGVPPAGFQISRAWAEPATVEVSGPESVVRGIAEVPTDVVDTSNHKRAFTAQPQVVRPGALVTLQPEQVRVNVIVDETPGPVELTLPVQPSDDAFTPDPPQVKVRLEGPPTLLERISDQVNAVADCTGITGRAGSAPVKLDLSALPPDEAARVNVALIDPARVRVHR